MRKVDAIQKINHFSNFGLNNSNTHFANINADQVQRKNIWWLEVPERKFSTGFYLLLCDKNRYSLTLLKIPRDALDLASLSYRTDKDCYRLYICNNTGYDQYMHDLAGPGQVNLADFIVTQLRL